MRTGKGLTGEGGALTGLIKRIVEAALDEELSAHIRETKPSNRRNGHTAKQIKTGLGEVEIRPPRDREGSFDPKVLAKWERNLAPEIENQIISMYGIGSSYADISAHIKRMYGLSYSPSFISSVPDRVYTEIETWKTRALEEVYAIIYLDAIHFKVREDRTIKSKAVYTVLGVDLEGNRDVLGIYIGQSEGSKHWGRVLESIRDRGVKDVIFFCIDGLRGFPDVILEIYPQSIIQRCIVHMIRTSLRYVSWKDYKGICKDLRKMYSKDDAESAMEELARFDKKWGGKYPEIGKKWRNSWSELSPFFDYPEAIRRTIYTTNTVESLNKCLRKVTKTKGAFVSEKALEKQLYLALKYNQKSWKRRVRSWPDIARSLRNQFPERLNNV